MEKKQRLNDIWKLVQKRGTVDVSQLCNIYNVTPMTIRRDLDTLADAGKLIRTHGGAILNNRDQVLEEPIHLRLETDIDIKEAIGQGAATTLTAGDQIFIGSGSTIYHFARMVDNARRLMVVTNSLNVALELNSRNAISIIMLGGELRSNTLATTGHFAQNMVNQFHFDAAYIGVTSIDKSGTFYHHSLVEKAVFETLRPLSDRFVVLADSSKMDRTDFMSVGQLQPGDILVTDTGISDTFKQGYEKLGVQVIVTE